MSDFKFPANIKQIGSIGHGLKIYIEDYVCSYLNQFAEIAGYNEQIAVMLGKYMEIDEQEVLFISGAIQGKFVETDNGILNFTDKSWEYILEQQNNYFSDLEIIGWMQSQPSYGVFLNSSYANYHINNFVRKYEVLFICDPIEKINAFYVYNESQTDLIESSGYFIYFDKNINMHEYMLENKLVKNTAKTMKDPTLKYLKQIKEKFEPEEVKKDITQAPKEFSWLKDKYVPEQEEDYFDIVSPSDKIQKKYEKTYTEQRRVVNLLVGLCGVLFVLTFLMGVGLLQNVDRITVLEDDLKFISTSYRDVINTTKDTTVFASQDKEKNETKNNSIAIIKEDGNKLLAEETKNETNLLDEPKEEIVPEAKKEEIVPEAKKEEVQETKKEEIVAEKEESIISTPEVIKEEKVDEIIEKEPEKVAKAASNIPEYYSVQKGDTLSFISLKFYGTKKMEGAIMKENNIDNANKIYFGKKLKLPKSQ